ncbi:MAG: UDP-N-acetylmuramate--L-alanine ligase [Anaerolineaceae bacterium]|nr:UDP-N-acetylmuramate--L-alanine ligase [Anaerolineaceae bacterium]
MSEKNTHIHLIGIGGTGLSAIAHVLLQQGYIVSGSDMHDSPLARSVAVAGGSVVIGHRAENITGADMILRSSAIPDHNPEVSAAREQGIPVYKRAEFLGKLMADHYSICVAGTHGKTTTTAMMAWLLAFQNQDPSYIIGSVAKNLNGNAHAGSGSVFVIEADEYDNMFLGLNPDIAIVTTMEHDHPDCFPTPEEYRRAFVQFIYRIKENGLLIVCADNPMAKTLLNELPANVRAYTYGFAKDADYQIIDTHNGIHHSLVQNHEKIADYELRIPGQHNAQNAAAVLAAAHQMELSMVASAKAIEQFEGTERRFDVQGTAAGITVIDDYAHHPTEIAATLHAARVRYPQSGIWVVWQPHTFSRTIELMDDFIHCFNDADHVLVTEVYASREKMEGFTSRTVAERIEHPDVSFTPTFNDAIQLLIKRLSKNDILLVCSAGDAPEISKQVLKDLKTKEGE